MVDGLNHLRIPSGQRYKTPGKMFVEGDASSASYWLAGQTSVCTVILLGFRNWVCSEKSQSTWFWHDLQTRREQVIVLQAIGRSGCKDWGSWVWLTFVTNRHVCGAVRAHIKHCKMVFVSRVGRITVFIRTSLPSHRVKSAVKIVPRGIADSPDTRCKGLG